MFDRQMILEQLGIKNGLFVKFGAWRKIGNEI